MFIDVTDPSTLVIIGLILICLFYFISFLIYIRPKYNYDGSGLVYDVAEAMAVFNNHIGQNDHTLMKQINAYVNEFLPSDSSVKTHYDEEKLSSLGKEIYYYLDNHWIDYKKKAKEIEFSNKNTI